VLVLSCGHRRALPNGRPAIKEENTSMESRAMGHRFERPIDILSEIELRLGAWMEKYGLLLLRIGMGTVFFWFGALKFLGLSPAAALVTDTMSWLPFPGFIHVLGSWEMAIGICFLYTPLLHVALLLLFLHMPGTFLPIVLLPGEVFRVFPFELTLEGQYIVKNLVLIAAAIVIGGKIRHRMQGLMRFAPDEFTALLHRGTWAVAKRGEKLVEQGEELDRVFFIHSGRFAVRVDGQEVAQRQGGQFVGEISFLTKATATATVEVIEPTRYLVWDRPLLEELIEKEPTLYYAMLSSMNLDLITKLLRPPQLSSLIAES
jgi:uncharacterized membrane protein YkgB